MPKLPHEDADPQQLDLFGISASKLRAEKAQTAKTRAAEVPARTSNRKLGDYREKTEPSMEQLRTVDQVAQVFQVSRATIWRWTKDDGPFPRPIKLSAGTSRWRLEDLRDYEERVAFKDPDNRTSGKSKKARTPGDPS